MYIYIHIILIFCFGGNRVYNQQHQVFLAYRIFANGPVQTLSDFLVTSEAPKE